jgi:hypothetical protein
MNEPPQPDMRASAQRDRRAAALRIEAGYFITTGLWPLLSMGSFEKVTGPKTDRWLVRMVGLLAISAGVTLALGTRSRDVRPETTTLAVTSALSFAAIDSIYAIKRSIRPIYLLEAAIEIALAAAVTLPGPNPGDETQPGETRPNEETARA